MADGETRGQGLGARGQGEDIQDVLYIGFGAFLDGVPARDMTAAEWASLAQEQRDRAVALDLYQVVTEDGGRRTEEDRAGGRRQAAGQERGTEGEVDGRSEGREIDSVADDDSAGVSDDRSRNRHVPRSGRKAARPE